MARVIREVVTLLNQLIHLEYDAIEACRSAVARVTDSEDRGRLGELLGDHRRHVDELADVVRNLGGEPAGVGDLRQALVRGRVALGALVGERAMLEAIRRNEWDIAAAYGRAASQPGVPVDVLAVLERHLCDERGHHAWVNERLDGPVSSIPGAG
jgi:uncharacterized protein (TIGR02284 family)